MAIEPKDADELLALWRTLFPTSFTVPIEAEANGQGLDVFAQQAAQIARVSEAIGVTTQAYYLRAHSTQVRPPAAGALAAAGEILIARAAPASGPITISRGTLVQVREIGSLGEELEGVRFALVDDVTIAAGSLGPATAAILAERVGYQGNVEAERIASFVLLGRATIDPATVEPGNVIRDNGAPDRFTSAMVGRYVRLVGGVNGGGFPRRITGAADGDPTSTITVDGPALTEPDTLSVEVEEWEDVGLSIEQPAATSQGRHGWLDAIGADRNVERQDGEGDESYRKRIGSLDDVVSPNALRRAAARVLTPLGIPFLLMETRDPDGLRGFIVDLDACDYGDVLNGQVMLSRADSVRFFVIVVGITGDGEFGVPYDADAPGVYNAADYAFCDGAPLIYNAALRALYDQIEKTRMGGVRWRLVRDASL